MIIALKLWPEDKQAGFFKAGLSWANPLHTWKTGMPATSELHVALYIKDLIVCIYIYIYGAIQAPD